MCRVSRREIDGVHTGLCPAEVDPPGMKRTPDGKRLEQAPKTKKSPQSQERGDFLWVLDYSAAGSLPFHLSITALKRLARAG